LACICGSIGIDHRFALLDLAPQQVICDPLCHQRILALIERTVQMVGTGLSLFPEPIMLFSCKIAALTCLLCPPFHTR
jgi:hypothetical protein